MKKNILNYVENYLYTFDEKKINEVDALIFCWISYFRINKNIYKQKSFDNTYVKELFNYKYIDNLLFDVFDCENSKKLITFLAASPRFRNIEIIYYIDNLNKNIEKQFAAMTFKINKNDFFVSFRGTDHTFVGWKEDFNMSYLKMIPSQVEAKKYLETIIKKYKKNIYVGGHSKGGNLSLYAYNFLDNNMKKYIKAVYNFDGPNLNEKYFSNSIKYDTNIIKKIIPQGSIVGMLFEKTNNYKIIKSNSFGILQHNPFTWEIKNNKFVEVNKLLFDSIVFKNSINNLIEILDEKELKIIINLFYEIIYSTKDNTVEMFIKNINKNFNIFLSSLNKFDKNQKQIILKVAKIYIKQVVINTFKNMQ